MTSIRRYGPSMVAPQVMPRPELGRGAEATFQVFESAFQTANDFIRPAVTKVQQTRGQQEAIAAVDETGPAFGLERTRDANSTALDVLPARAPRGRVGPTRQNALFLEMGQAHGIDPLYLSVTAQLESGGDPNAQNPNSSAGGLFQQLDQNALDFGVINRFDPRQSTEGAAKFARDNTRQLAAVLGRAPTIGELYLAHQQGGGGASALLNNPNALAVDIVGVEAVELNGGTLDMTAQEFANLWIDKANREARAQGGRAATSVNVPQGAEFELRATNSNSFEPRLPFTVRDAAFNAAADRVIQSRAMVALDDGIAIATQKADGNLDVLREELEKVRSTVMGNLPKEMPNLGIALEESFNRSKSVAERQAIALSQRRVVAGQQEAAASALVAINGEAERLALTGASGEEIAAHMTTSQAALAQFGPREEFMLNGQMYPADPSRAGTLTPLAIQESLSRVTNEARKVMLEAEFQQSSAPGQFVAELRNQIFSGNPPLPAGESLELLRSLEGRVRATESARRTAANAARKRVEEETTDRINNFVEMTEAGIPVAIPQAERQSIMADLSPFPELQREAMLKFAVADAAVETHGMSGPELVQYVDTVRADVANSLAEGELDMAGVEVLQSLEDRVKKIQDAITAETVGLPLVEQLMTDGATAENVDWDAMRERASGNAEVLEQITEVEAFARDIETVSDMTAEEREIALEAARNFVSDLATKGGAFGAGALMTTKVLDRLDEWSQSRADLAKSDAVKFAGVAGVSLPSFEGAEGLVAIGEVIAARVEAIGPAALGEGVENPVPLSGEEIAGISETFDAAPRGEQGALLAKIAQLGEDQGKAILGAIGQSSPTMFAAGTVYLGGNTTAASTILRGADQASGIKLDLDTRGDFGGGEAKPTVARTEAIGELLEGNIISNETLANLDRIAMAYARGLALSSGGTAIGQDELVEGYKIATGLQEDGTGGAQTTSYGMMVLPKGWDADRAEATIDNLDDGDILAAAGGTLTDQFGDVIDARHLRDSIEFFRPVGDGKYVPMDADGAAFGTLTGGDISTQTPATRGLLVIDIQELETRQRGRN